MRLDDMSETSVGGIATFTGNGTGFEVGPGTLSRPGLDVTGIKTKRSKKRKKKVSETHVPGHMDHEVRMAHGELLNLANNSIELYKIVKGIGEREGLPGWISAYITLANDYMESAIQYMREEQIEQATDATHQF